jgi:hypothetical protein
MKMYTPEICNMGLKNSSTTYYLLSIYYIPGTIKFFF